MDCDSAAGLFRLTVLCTIALTPTDPIALNPAAELWYDTDQVAPPLPASNISFTPVGAITATDVQSAIARLPQGKLGLHTLVAGYVTTGTHTVAQDEGLTLTINEPVGRALKFTAMLRPYCPGGANRIVYTLVRNGVNVCVFGTVAEVLSTTVAQSFAFVYVVPSSVGGAGVVWKIQIQAGTTNTAVSSHADASAPRQFLIEDIGV